MLRSDAFNVPHGLDQLSHRLAVGIRQLGTFVGSSLGVLVNGASRFAAKVALGLDMTGYQVF